MITVSTGPDDTHFKREYEFTDDYCVIVGLFKFLFTLKNNYIFRHIPMKQVEKLPNDISREFKSVLLECRLLSQDIGCIKLNI